MLTTSKLVQKQQAKIHIIHGGIEDDFPIPSGGYSSVVCTLVLCTIPDPIKAIERIKSILKPNGKKYILEHVVSQDNPLRTFQNLITPIWKKIAVGCHLNRDTVTLLATMGFISEQFSYFGRGDMFYQAVGTFNNNTGHNKLRKQKNDKKI